MGQAKVIRSADHAGVPCPSRELPRRRLYDWRCCRLGVPHLLHRRTAYGVGPTFVGQVDAVTTALMSFFAHGQMMGRKETWDKNSRRMGPSQAETNAWGLQNGNFTMVGRGISFNRGVPPRGKEGTPFGLRGCTCPAPSSFFSRPPRRLLPVCPVECRSKRAVDRWIPQLRRHVAHHTCRMAL